jgi:type IV pilus assembly protein PilQ
MKSIIPVNRCKRRLAGLWRGFIAVLLSVSMPVLAGDLTAISWEDGAAAPTLQVWVSGNPAYDVQSLDGGQRLRLNLPSTVLKDVSDIEGRGAIKGVYPYLNDTGTGVVIDFLLAEPGALQVEATNYGLRVAAGSSPAKAASAADVAPAQAAPAATPSPPPIVEAKPAPVPAQKAAAKPAAPQNAIEEIVYSKLPGDRVQITLRMSATPPKPAVFTTSNPARLAFDFAGTRVALPKSNVKVSQGAVTSIDAIEAVTRSRVVVNLVRSAGYTTTSDARSFTITVDSAAAGAVAQPAKTTRFATAPRPGKHSLKNIDFRRGPHGDGKIVIGLSDSGVGIDIREQAGEILVDFVDTGITAEMQRRLDVTDFGTPVTNIDTFVQGKNVRMVIAAKGKYEHLAYQAGDVFTVNIKPIVDKGERKKDEFGYSGEKLSLNFQNIDVRAALQVIADFTGLNFVTSDTVKGNLTLRLKDVPWDQALDIIAEAKNLSIRKSGNVVRVGPTEEVAAREKSVFEAAKSAIELEPLVSELIQVNYAKAEDMAKLLKSIKAIDAGGQMGNNPLANVSVQKLETESNSLLSPRGQVTTDARTNSLLVQDIPSKIKEIRKLVAALDQPVRQVMIETRLVEASDNFARNLGVRWGGFKWANAANPNQAQPIGCGMQECIVDYLNGDDIRVDNYLAVNLAAGAVRGVNAGAFTIGTLRLSDASILTLELSALEAEGKGRVISSPRLITGNQKKARIEQGQEGIFRALGGLGTSSFIIRKAVLALEVTPQITPDDRIVMDVNITKDTFADATAGLINKKEITTQVLLDNGETVVIGGVYEQTEVNNVNKIPFLGDIPYLGFLFRNSQKTNDKSELLIFLTPRILSERLSLK